MNHNPLQRPTRSPAGGAATHHHPVGEPRYADVPPLTHGSQVLYHGVLQTWICHVISIRADGWLVFQKADHPTAVLRLAAPPTAFRPSGVALAPWAVDAPACSVSPEPTC